MRFAFMETSWNVVTILIVPSFITIWIKFDRCWRNWVYDCGFAGFIISDGVWWRIQEGKEVVWDIKLQSWCRIQYFRGEYICRIDTGYDVAKQERQKTTIRILGGLLSAHYLTSIHSDPSIQDDAPSFLEMATDLGDRLIGAFDSPSGIPWSNINLARREGIPDRGNQGVASLAEAASLQLELKYLSHLTGDYVYWRKAEKVSPNRSH